MKNKQKKRGIRTRGREIAVQFLYSTTFFPNHSLESIQKSYDNFIATLFDKKNPINQKASDFAKELILGVISHLEEIDEKIKVYSKNWKIDRIGRVELSILRLSIYEMLHRTDVPYKVAIDEGIELSKIFAEDKSRIFINGILDAVGKEIQNKHKTGGEM